MLNQVEGFWGGRKNHYRQAMRVLWKSWQYAYVGRKLRKRDFRRLWITRINAACRVNGTSLLASHRVAEEVRHRARSQGAVRHGDQRRGGLQESGRPGHRGRLRPVSGDLFESLHSVVLRAQDQFKGAQDRA